MKAAVEAVQAAQGKATGRHTSYYLLTLLLIPVALLLATVPIFNSKLFQRYGDVSWVVAQRDLFKMANRNCQVLLFGDSSAMSGLDPTLVHNETGLTTCNIAATVPTLALTGLEPLTLYLARNPRPKYLIFETAYDDFEPFSPERDKLKHLDGIATLIRYNGWLRAAPYLIKHPDYLLSLQQYVYSEGGKQIVKALFFKAPPYNPEKGSYILVPKRPAEICNAATSVAHPDTAWTAFLRDKYSTAADHVLIDVAPTPDCNAAFPHLRDELAGLTDNTLHTYPREWFADGKHFTRTGAVRLSQEMAEQISKTAVAHSSPSGY